MEHIIIGAGNLGLDLQVEIMRQLPNDRVNVLSKSTGFDVTDEEAMMLYLKDLKADYLWYCVGAGSVEEAHRNPEMCKKIYIDAPRKILQFAPRNTRVLFFSSDYCADQNQPLNPRAQLGQDEKHSLYVNMKCFLEGMCRSFDRPLTAVVRVGSLYGTAKPKNTFPGKILNAFASQKGLRVRLPQNLVTPTPTLWAASQLVSHADKLFSEEGSTIHHLAPDGNVSVFDWGVFILTGIREASAFVREEFYDDNRPRYSALGSTFIPHNWHWHDLYKTYFHPDLYVDQTPLNESKPSEEASVPVVEKAALPVRKSPSKPRAKRSS